MVDTYLRPRPEFSTFLQSDNATEQDGMAFHRYKAALRKNKVTILQRKREADVSEKVRSLEEYRRSLAHSNTDLKVGGHGNRSRHYSEPQYIPPTPIRRPQSAGLHRKASLDSSNVVDRGSDRTRPKTADPAYINNSAEPLAPKIGWGYEGTLLDSQQQQAQAQLLEEEAELAKVSQQRQLDALVRDYQYGTTTHRSNCEVGWDRKLPHPVPNPVSTLEMKPDLVSVRLNIKRLEDSPAAWQSIGRVWDYLQQRESVTRQRQRGSEFCSPNKTTLRLPGYSGHAKMTEFCDNPLDFPLDTPPLPLCTEQPFHTNTARRANIPGYSGHVHWTTSIPAHSIPAFPEPTSSARVHRRLPTYPQGSPFVRNSPLSKMVTLTSPHNPFSKVEP